MSAIEMVSFQRSTLPSETYLSELGDGEAGPPYTIHGVALGAGDVTKGRSGITKVWPAEELQEAAKTLQGTSLVVNHENSVGGVVGEVTKAGYKDGVGVVYEAELHDEDVADKVEDGLLEVSVRGKHADVNELSEDEETGAIRVEEIEFKNLSIVSSGAAESNTLQMGEHAELSESDLVSFTEELEQDAEVEPGAWVKWGDNRGIVLSQVRGQEEVDVDVYEEDGNKWRAIGETESVDLGELEPWDVDEDDIGEEKADEESEDEEGDNESEEEAAESGVDGLDESDDVEHSSDEEIDSEATEGEENAATTKDVPSESAQPSHDSIGDDMLEVIEVFIEENGKDSTFADFADWITESELGTRGEGEERYLDDPDSIKEMREDSQERFIPDEVEELQDYDFHEVSWDGTTEDSWDTPDMEDFVEDEDVSSWDDLGEEQKSSIGDHFLISSSGFPADEYGDMKLPVVEPNGDLNVNALSAVKGGRGVSAVEGLSDDMEAEIVDYVNMLANEHFDRNWGEEEAAKHYHEVAAEMMGKFVDMEDTSQEDPLSDFLEWADDDAVEEAANEYLDADGSMEDAVAEFVDWLNSVLESDDEEEMETHSIDGTDGSPTEPTSTVGGVRVLPGDDLLQEYMGESEMDSTTINRVKYMNDEIESKLEELDEPVAVEADELQQLQDKADRFEEMSENLEALRERTDILDEVDRSQVEELNESDDPVVVESARYEELQTETEQVKSVYAASLAEEMRGFDADELTDRFSIEELREKHEEIVGDVEEELSSESADPKSQDPSEEELEDDVEGGKQAELEEEAAQKREEIREKILGGD